MDSVNVLKNVTVVQREREGKNEEQEKGLS